MMEHLSPKKLVPNWYLSCCGDNQSHQTGRNIYIYIFIYNMYTYLCIYIYTYSHIFLMSSTMETKGVATSTFLCYRTTIYIYTFIPLKRVVYLILFKYFCHFLVVFGGSRCSSKATKKNRYLIWRYCTI